MRRLGTLRAWSALLLLVGLFAGTALADSRAQLSQGRIALDGTVTLTIDTDQSARPELGPLQRDFEVLGTDDSRRFVIDGSGVRASRQYRIELRPRRAGALQVPSLAVGADRTTALSLQVSAASAAVAAASDPGTASASAPGAVFVETVVSDPAPYVQQAVGVTVRLHYAVNLFNGELRQPEPAGGSLTPVGNDTRSVRALGGRHYRVLERHYLLVPERSGELVLPGGRFRGQGAGGFFDDWFGDGRDAYDVQARPLRLTVRPLPTAAPAEWLPARSVALSVARPPDSARAGEAFDVVVEMRVDGAIAAQLPEITLAAEGDAQIFPEPPESTDSFADGRPGALQVRRFSVVPEAPGELVLEVAPVAWWHAGRHEARSASVAPIRVRVTPGAPAARDDAMPDTGAPSTQESAGSSQAPRDRKRMAWMLALGIALLAVAAIALKMRRRDARPRRIAGPGHRAPAPPAMTPAPPASTDLRSALAQGDLARIGQALRESARPPAATLADVRDRLADAAQRDALSKLERALWADGDAEAARTALRSAFAGGPRWQVSAVSSAPLLPPLYPER